MNMKCLSAKCLSSNANYRSILQFCIILIVFFDSDFNFLYILCMYTCKRLRYVVYIRIQAKLSRSDVFCQVKVKFKYIDTYIKCVLR